ncbi:uncharacterized protein At4g02000-like [Castanea sativa]|uniref:uncharacterized protein At4g02000-like n=1 Tax=Castanea sativa TaxID=21020 RepID=UPI003F652948
MVNVFNAREYRWTESSDSNDSSEPFADELELESQSSDDNEVPFTRHGPIVEADPSDLSNQREFWSNYAIDDLNHVCNEGPWSVDRALFVLEKWRPNLILGRLQLNYVSLWLQLQGLLLEYQYPEFAEKLGQIMGIFERVDVKDKLRMNIRFMRLRVPVDPWSPLLTGFMLKLDDGVRVSIQCLYERVHKLCNRCGLIGHTRSQCTYSMDDVEMSLFRQRVRIQQLH